MSWLDEAGLGQDAATISAYNMLLDAISGGSNYSGATGANIAKARAVDSVQGGVGLRGAEAAAYSQGSARNIADAVDETKREASARSLEDQALYGRTFQKGALENNDFQMNVATAKRALKKDKQNQRKKKYGTMLKAIGAVASVFNPAIGAAVMAAGQGIGASGNTPGLRKFQKTNTSNVTADPTRSQAGTEGTSNLAPVAKPINYTPAAGNYSPAGGYPAGVRIDPLTGLPY